MSNAHYHAQIIYTNDPNSPRVREIFAASDLNNRAIAAQGEGRFEEAVELHRQALAKKLTIYDPDAVEVAIAYEGLGTALRLCKRVAESKEYHQKALYIRDDIEFGGLGKGVREDAALSRESMACVLEAEGKMEEAREMRMRGEAKDEMLCAHWNECVKQGCLLPRSQLRACGACRSVFYHSTHCQKKDWNDRHKAHCKAYQEKMKANATAPA